MSDYEAHIGKIRKIQPLENESFEDQCKRLYYEKGGKSEDYYEGLLFDEYYNDVFHINGVLYEIFEREEKDPYEYYCHMTDLGDGTYSFNTMFYNGGTCLSEMIEEALEKL